MAFIFAENEGNDGALNYFGITAKVGSCKPYPSLRWALSSSIVYTSSVLFRFHTHARMHARTHGK